MNHDTHEPTSVYRYYDDSGILIYVGITKRGMRRQAEHNTGKEWWAHVARQEVEHFPARSEALKRERELITFHCPPFNKQHNPNAEPIRVAYLALRDLMASGLTLRDAARAAQGRIELDVHDFGSTPNLVLRSRLDDAALACALSLPVNPPRVFGLSKQHHVKSLQQQGPVVLIHASTTTKHPIASAYAQIKFEGQALVLRNVHLTLDHSDSEHCNKKCRKRGHAPRREIRWVRPDGEGRAAR